MIGNLELYRIFREVANEKSFSSAAKQLYITQPAVSQAVKQLEEMLEVRLFIRGPRGVVLTREGEMLLGYVNSAMNLIDSAETRLNDLKSLSAGELRIGASDTVSKRFLLGAIEKFHELYPDIALRITNRTSTETLELLKGGKIDLGFVNMPIASGGVTFDECTPVHDIFVAGKGFEYLKDKEMTLDELAAMPIIMLERASNSRRWVDRHFLSCGVQLKPDIELGAHDLLLDYASIGLGAACVIEEFASEAIENGTLFKLNITKPVPARSISACWLTNIELTFAAEKFVGLVKLREHR